MVMVLHVITLMLTSYDHIYIPSPAEKEWYDDSFGKICEIASRSSQIESMNLALKKERKHMSILDGSPIEPLTGIGRHPFANVGCRLPVKMTSIFNVSHLEINNNCNKKTKNNAKFFDLGCTQYKEDKRPAGRGSSIPFFRDTYSNLCVNFNEIWAWEVAIIQNWWRYVPNSVKPDIHFYNTPVSAEVFKFAINKCTRSDFVVVKLDIDNTEVEMQIIKVIEEYSHLIDELYFEYHYYFDGLNFGWGNLNQIRDTHNVTSAITLMSRLRKKGIRAHFWI